MAKKPEHDDLIQIRCPATITTAVKRAAKARKVNASAYVRAAVVDRLCNDGLIERPAAAT